MDGSQVWYRKLHGPIIWEMYAVSEVRAWALCTFVVGGEFRHLYNEVEDELSV
jgi:hypothetical protein